MTTQTTNYSFTKDDINEPYDVLRVNANLDAIDTEIKKKETQIGDKANLVTVTKTNLVAAINEVKEQTNSLDANKANKSQPNWIAATLQNGWGGTVLYRKDEFGNLQIKGQLNTIGTTTAGTTIFNVPGDYYTAYAKIVTIRKGNVTPYDSAPWFYIDNAGNFKVNNGQTLPSAGTTNASLWVNEIILR